MHRAMTDVGREPDVTCFALHSDDADEPVLGQLVERGLHDELKGTAYAIIDGVDGRTHHLVFSDLEMRGDAKPGAIVKTRAYDDAGGRKRLSLATRAELAIEAQASAPGATGSTASFSPRSPLSAAAASARRSGRQWTAGSIISSNFAGSAAFNRNCSFRRILRKRAT